MQEELNAAAKKAGKVAKNVASKVENLEADATEGQSEVRDTLNTFTDHVSEMASDYLGKFNSSPLGFIRQYPVQAAVGGIVLGYILGTAVAKKAVTE